MTFLLAIAGCLGEAGIIYTMVILTRLSEKLGSVTKMPPYFRAYYLAVGLFCISLAVRLVRIGSVIAGPSEAMTILDGDAFYLFLHHIPLAVGTFVALAVSVKYWGWLLRE